MTEGPKLRIGLVSPPLPSPRHEGLELALDGLAKGLNGRGHDVVLLTIVDPMRTKQWASQVGLAARMLYRAAGLEGELGSCDIIHDHTLAGLFVRNLHHRAPVVTTNYGPFDADPIPMYRRRPDDHVPMLAVSPHQGLRAPDSVTVTTAIHPGIDVGAYPFRPRGSGYLLTTCRMEPSGGIPESIEIAKACDTPLLICSRVEEPAQHDFFHDIVRPHLGSDVQFAGELCMRDRIDLIAGATALLHPVRWAEPFGVAIVEAMACGTPCIASPGSASEIIEYGETGFIADSKAGFIKAVQRVGSISRAACRERAERFFDCDEVASHHEDFYREILQAEQEGRPCNRSLLPVSTGSAMPAVDVQPPNSIVTASATGWHSSHF